MSAESDVIFRFIEGMHCAKGPKGCRKCLDQGITRRLCLIRVFKEADEMPRPVIELDREDQQNFVYDVLRCFDNVQQAHHYAEKHDIHDGEY